MIKIVTTLDNQEFRWPEYPTETDFRRALKEGINSNVVVIDNEARPGLLSSRLVRFLECVGRRCKFKLDTLYYPMSLSKQELEVPLGKNMKYYGMQLLLSDELDILEKEDFWRNNGAMMPHGKSRLVLCIGKPNMKFGEYDVLIGAF